MLLFEVIIKCCWDLCHEIFFQSGIEKGDVTEYIRNVFRWCFSNLRSRLKVALVTEGVEKMRIGNLWIYMCCLKIPPENGAF